MIVSMSFFHVSHAPDAWLSILSALSAWRNERSLRVEKYKAFAGYENEQIRGPGWAPAEYDDVLSCLFCERRVKAPGHIAKI